MRSIKHLLFLFSLIVSMSLSGQSYINGIDSVHMVDSIIYIDNIKFAKPTPDTLTLKIADAVLKKYILKQGFLTSDSLGLPDNPTEKDYEKIHDQLVFRLDTIYLEKFKSTITNFAVASYFLAPYMASSHCFLPYKALIINSDRGFIVTNEDFIPDNFIIDSFEMKDNNIVIFCSEYDCYNHETTKYIRVKLEENIK